VIVILVGGYRTLIVWWVYRNQYTTQHQAVASDDEDRKLILLAEGAREKAMADLSNYRVGACVQGASGKTYAGCNVEFGNYSNTIHAEEGAIAQAIVAGERKIIAVAVVTQGEEPAWPCGMCLQSLYEIGGPELRVIAGNGQTHQVKRMHDLLPHGFSLERKEE